MSEVVFGNASFGGDVEPILPDGWKEGDDVFAGLEPENGTDEIADELRVGDDLSDLLTDEDEAAEPDAPTTGDEEPAEEPSADGSDEAGADETPAPETRPSRKLKLKVNHSEEEIDVNALSDEDLIALLQKGRAFDARIEAENKKRYREVYNEQIEAGMTEAVARMAASQEVGGKSYALTDDEEAAAESAPAAPEPQPVVPQRDLNVEVQQLKLLYPDVKELPTEVTQAWTSGVPLLSAYLAYQNSQVRKAAAKLKKENQILKQNAASAAMAPVTPVSGGGDVTPKKKDPFEAGFDSEMY